MNQPIDVLARRAKHGPGLASQVLVERPADLPSEDGRGQLGVFRHEAGKVDGLADAELGPLVVADEGAPGMDEGRSLGAAEDAIEQTGGHLLLPLLPDEELGDEVQRALRRAGHLDQRREGIVFLLHPPGRVESGLPQEQEARAVRLASGGEALGQISMAREQGERAGEPGRLLRHRPNWLEAAMRQGPVEVEVVEPPLRTHDVHDEAVLQLGQLVDGGLTEPHRLEETGAQRASNGPKLGPDERRGIVWSNSECVFRHPGPPRENSTSGTLAAVR